MRVCDGEPREVLVFIQSGENLTVPNMPWKVNHITTDYGVPAEVRACPAIGTLDYDDVLSVRHSSQVHLDCDRFEASLLHHVLNDCDHDAQNIFCRNLSNRSP
jgi:hypothetical protein